MVGFYMVGWQQKQHGSCYMFDWPIYASGEKLLWPPYCPAAAFRMQCVQAISQGSMCQWVSGAPAVHAGTVVLITPASVELL